MHAIEGATKSWHRLKGTDAMIWATIGLSLLLLIWGLRKLSALHRLLLLQYAKDYPEHWPCLKTKALRLGKTSKHLLPLVLDELKNKQDEQVTPELGALLARRRGLVYFIVISPMVAGVLAQITKALL